MSGSSPEFKPALLNGPDAAQQLQHGFAWLYFTDPRLERGFRENHFQQARSVVCTHFVLSILLFLSFIAIDEWILLRNNSVWLTSMRITGVCVLLACVVLTAARKLSPDRYPLAIYGLAPLFGLCMVGNELLDQPAGVSFVPTIVLTVFTAHSPQSACANCVAQQPVGIQQKVSGAHAVEFVGDVTVDFHGIGQVAAL